MLKDEELTYKIRGCVFQIYRQLGVGAKPDYSCYSAPIV